MAFGSLAPNANMAMGMKMLQMAQDQQRRQGTPQQGLLERLLNPASPPGGAPTELAAPGMNANGSRAPMLPGFMQAGLLPRLMPQMFGGPGGPAPMGSTMPQVPANPLGGLY